MIEGIELQSNTMSRVRLSKCKYPWQELGWLNKPPMPFLSLAVNLSSINVRRWDGLVWPHKAWLKADWGSFLCYPDGFWRLRGRRRDDGFITHHSPVSDPPCTSQSTSARSPAYSWNIKRRRHAGGGVITFAHLVNTRPWVIGRTRGFADIS